MLYFYICSTELLKKKLDSNLWVFRKKTNQPCKKLVKTQQCAVVAQRKPEVPYQLVWDNRFCAFFPFDLGLTGHTWPASCRWWRGQSPRDTLERYPSAAFPVGAKPISVSPRLFPPEKKNYVKSGWLVTSMSCSWEWKAYLNSRIFGGVRLFACCPRLGFENRK
jgi:hypothetical protein